MVFKPVHHRLPPNEYETATALTETLAKGCSIQADDLESLAKFFEAYYTNGDLGRGIVEKRIRCEFKTVAQDFELISSRTQDIYVPFEGGRSLIDQLLAIGQLTADLRRKLQRYKQWGSILGNSPKARESSLYPLRGDSEKYG